MFSLIFLISAFIEYHDYKLITIGTVVTRLDPFKTQKMLEEIKQLLRDICEMQKARIVWSIVRLVPQASMIKPIFNNYYVTVNHIISHCNSHNHY